MFEWGRAICYSGYREGQSPKTCTYPTYEQIVEDLKILDNLGFKYIRMYDPVSYAEMTCQVIRDLGLDMKMMLGPDLISEVNNPGCPWMQTNFSEEELAQRAERNDGNIEKLKKAGRKGYGGTGWWKKGKRFGKIWEKNICWCCSAAVLRSTRYPAAPPSRS